MRRFRAILLSLFCLPGVVAEADDADCAECASEVLCFDTRGTQPSDYAAAVVHVGGELAASETWSADKTHIVYGTLTIPANKTLTVASGALVKFVGGGIQAKGPLTANGATFTDVADDATGGDTLKDGWTCPCPSYTLTGSITCDATTQIRCCDFRCGYLPRCDTDVIRFDTRGLKGDVPTGTTVHWGGVLAASETWSAGMTHVVYGTITVPAGVTLTIEPGASVLFVGGGLTVRGTCLARGVKFGDSDDECPVSSYVLEGSVETDSATEFACRRMQDDSRPEPGVSRIFRFETDLSDYRFAGDPREVTFCALWDGSSTVSVTETRPDGSTVVLTKGTAESNGVFLWDAGEAPGLYTLRHVTDTNVLEASFYRLVGATVHSGVLTGTEVWSAETIHVLNGSVTVGAGAQLTIEEGAIVKAMPRANLVVDENGRCIARGVTFTHVADDARGGDTLADGPADDVPENDYLIFGCIEDDAATDYRYAQRSINGTIAHDSEWNPLRVYVVDGTLTVASGVSLTIPKGTVVKFTDGSALSVERGGSCIAEGAVFTHIADDATGGDTMGDGDETRPKYGAYVIVGNVIDDDFTEYRYAAPITLSGTISKNTSWRARGVYQVTGNLTVANGATLTIQPGAIVKFGEGLSLTVNAGATLNALGTRAAPIVFTSIKDDEFGGDTNGDGDASQALLGDWHQITGHGTVNMEYCKLLWCSAENNQGALYPLGGTWRFDNSVVAHCRYDCMRSYGGDFDACNSIFMDASMGAAPSSGQNNFVNCIFYELETAIRWDSGCYVNCVFAHIYQDIIDTKFYSATVGSEFRNCCLWNPEGAGDHASAKVGKNGNIYADPKFIDADTCGFRVAEDSPCLDAGDTSAAPLRDYYGQPRVGAAADIGIYEVMPRYVASDVDLRALNVNVASSVVVGDELTVSWTVANNGTASVYDSWRDKFELVSSRGEKIPLGERPMKSGLAAGGQRSCSASWKIPVVAEGEYTVLVTVNYARDVFEGTLTENNVMSSGGIRVSVPEVAAAEGAAFRVGSKDEGVMHFTLGADSTDRLITIGAADGVRALFGTTGVPTETYNVGSVKASEGTICFIVPDGATDVYVRLVNEGDGDVDCTASFSAAKVKILDVTPRTVPHDGKVTVRVEGAGLNRVQSVAFRAADATLVPCPGWRMDSSGLIVLSADGTKLAQGAEYRLALTDDKGEQVDSEQKLSVTQEPAKPEVWAKMNAPSTVRDGRQYLCTIEYGNKGNADAVAPLLQVSVRGGGALRADKDDGPSDDLVYVGIGGSGDAGVLVPGEVKKLEFLYNAGSSSDSMTLSIGEDADIAAAAARMALRGEDATDYFAAKELVEKIEACEPCGVYYGYVRDADGYPVCGYYVTVTNGEGEIVADAVSDERGHYVTETVVQDDERMDVSVPNLPLMSYVRVEGAGDNTVVSAFCRVTGETYQAERGDDGLYRFRGIGDGVFVVAVRDGGLLASGMIYVEQSAHCPLILRLAEPNAVNGTFAGDGSEVSPMILLTGAGQERVTEVAVDGSFAFSDLPSGTYSVSFAGENMNDYSAEWELSVVGGQTLVCTITKTNNIVGVSASGENVRTLTGVNAVFASSKHTVTKDNLLEYLQLVQSNSPARPPSDRNCKHNRNRHDAAMKMYRWMVNELLNASILSDELDEVQRELNMQFATAAALIGQGLFPAVTRLKSVGKATKLAATIIPTLVDTTMSVVSLQEDLSEADYAINQVCTAFSVLIAAHSTPLEIVKAIKEGEASRLLLQLRDVDASCKKVFSELSRVSDDINLLSSICEIMDCISSLIGIVQAVQLGVDRTRLLARKSELQAELSVYLDNINGNIDSVLQGPDYPLCCPKGKLPVTTTPVQTNAVEKVVSCDPNEVSGPIGLGDPETERFMRPGEWMTYTVYFENASNATAGAQEVFVTNPLSEWLDWETFEMGEVAFANQIDTGLSGLQVGKCETDLKGTAYRVRSNVSIDKNTGVVDWYLRLVDPATASGWPEDPYAGFLQPNDETHCGEGHLTYRVRIREDAPRNVLIENAATIVFDYNEEIPTDPSWWNTVGWPLTAGEAVNNEELTWVSGGAADWVPVSTDVAFDGQHDAMVTGIANNTNAWVVTVVEGPGTVSFAWCGAMESRNTKAQFLVDGAVEAILTGSNGWESVSVTVYGEGTHELKWRLVTGRSGASANDFAALDCVGWNPTEPPTLADALNPALKWTVDGDAEWHGVARDSLVSVREAWASVSGLGDCEHAAVETQVYGSGTLRFEWAVSCEEEYDELILFVDNKPRKSITGDVGWRADAVEITGKTWHTVRWEYVKDDLDEPELVGDNRAMLDNVAWDSGDELLLPTIEGDEGATVTGDAETGFVVKPSEGKTAVEVTIPQGVDAAKVTIEVSPKVASVKPNGAKVKIVSGGADITEFLNVPASDGSGVVDLTKAMVKEEYVKETLDVEKGAKIELGAANPSLTTPNTRAGLFYQLREGETLGGMKDGDSKVGDGQPWTPEIKVKGGNSAFYSIEVGKGE